ncbi:hypothetical protein BMETH_1841_1 [methanotrophic bacterial endosymbiont of Bathymodiolus sp.]|nr:hypothetical protein BMETH_1841_1 [methanotrophic bacterial endosymbiont of Bathymodiolus sp.]
METETPPRAWGRRTRHKHVGGNWRNTPTGVGKTVLEIANSTGSRKHPHGRGEDTISHHFS